MRNAAFKLNTNANTYEDVVKAIDIFDKDATSAIEMSISSTEPVLIKDNLPWYFEMLEKQIKENKNVEIRELKQKLEVSLATNESVMTFEQFINKI